MNSHADMRQQVFGLLKTVSRNLATNKMEMDVFLENEVLLSTRDGAGGPGYVEELRNARQILSRCPDLETFFRELADHASGAVPIRDEVSEPKIGSGGFLIAGWGTLLAFVLSGVSGFCSWPWWVPIVAGVGAAVVRDGAQGFHLTKIAGAGFLVRSIIMSALLMGAIYLVGYGLGRLVGPS